jgi:hypothetical protein
MAKLCHLKIIINNLISHVSTCFYFFFFFLFSYFFLFQFSLSLLFFLFSLLSPDSSPDFFSGHNPPPTTIFQPPQILQANHNNKLTTTTTTTTPSFNQIHPITHNSKNKLTKHKSQISDLIGLHKPLRRARSAPTRTQTRARTRTQTRARGQIRLYRDRRWLRCRPKRHRLEKPKKASAKAWSPLLSSSSPFIATFVATMPLPLKLEARALLFFFFAFFIFVSYGRSTNGRRSR